MTPEETRQVLHVAARAEAADGTGPLDEATLLEIRMRPDDVRGWVRPEGFGLLIEDQIHLCVDPDQRDSGIGGELLEALLADTWPRRSLEAWSHADHPAARRLATRHDFEVVREMWVMRRPADQPLPPLELPDGVRIRGFEPADTDALLALNAASFAAHPEQGAMDATGFAERCAESWFDPAGLLIASDDHGTMLGFHWTKIHDRDHGEVYVVGVSPATQGRGLGRLLTLAGLDRDVEDQRTS